MNKIVIWCTGLAVAGVIAGYGQPAAVAGGAAGGPWGRVTGVPGLAALNLGQGAQVNSVWCTSAGNCVAGGYYTARGGDRQGFVATEHNGRWGTPVPLPGLAAVNKGGFAQILSLSCATPRNCTAAGYYSDRSGHYQAFITQNK